MLYNEHIFDSLFTEKLSHPSKSVHSALHAPSLEFSFYFNGLTSFFIARFSCIVQFHYAIALCF